MSTITSPAWAASISLCIDRADHNALSSVSVPVADLRVLLQEWKRSSASAESFKLSRRLKYVIFDEIQVVLGPESMTHIQLAKVASGREITSAGFCRISINTDDTVDVSTFGESVGLGKHSSVSDRNIILRAFFI
jgi:hypothetical protein